MLQIKVINDATELLGQHDLWNGLSRGVPFRETHWLGPWWQFFGENCEANVLVARDDRDRVCGILPLYRPADAPDTLRMMGDGAACSDDVSVLADSHRCEEVGQAMGEFLAAHSADRTLGWNSMDIDGVVEGDIGIKSLVRGLRSGGAIVQGQSRMSIWWRPSDESWDKHVSSHSKTQRRKMRKWAKRIGNDGLSKQVATNDQELNGLLDCLINLHQRRWNSVGEVGSFADPKFREFVSESAREFLSCDRLYLTALKQGEDVIGAELDIIGQNRMLYCFSSGYDLDSAELEPGRVLGVDTLQQLYRDNLMGINYMRGDEPYKARMASESSRVVRVRAAAPGFLPRMQHAVWNARFELSQLARKTLRRDLIDVTEL